MKNYNHFNLNHFSPYVVESMCGWITIMPFIPTAPQEQLVTAELRGQGTR